MSNDYSPEAKGLENLGSVFNEGIDYFVKKRTAVWKGR